MNMITCPNCGYDHPITDDHKMMEQFTMQCHEETCRIVFEVDLEIIAHTRRASNSRLDCAAPPQQVLGGENQGDKR